MPNEQQAAVGHAVKRAGRRSSRRVGQRAGLRQHRVWFEVSMLESRVLLAVDPAAVPFYPIAKTAVSMPNFPHAPNGPLAVGASAPQGLTPAQVRGAYGVNNILFGNIAGDGSGQTIAIVVAYHNPTAQTDLQAFNTAFALPNPPSFQILNQQGLAGPLPGTDPTGGWELEAALDIQWVHAMAPAASLIVFEANDAFSNNLLAAVDAARRFPSVSVVSMSFGGPEFAGERFQDATFTTPLGHQGVTFLAASGDDGAFGTGTSVLTGNYPAASPNVVSVGGTTLSLSGNDYGSEIGWGNGQASGFSGGSGGGISAFEPQPLYQQGVVTQSTTQRVYPDVAMNADPASGVAVYNEFNFGDGGAGTGWVPGGVGGTSLACPLWAGLIGIANQGRQLNNLPTLDGVSEVLPRLYQLPSAVFHDITSGDNGYPAGPGYDLVTGLGTPIADQLIPALDGPFIGNFVFNDVNIDGIQNDNAGGVPDVQVQLFSVGINGVLGGGDDVVVNTTTTDANGQYGFSGMAPGTYYVNFGITTGFQISPPLSGGNATLDSNAEPTSGNTATIVVTNATFDATIDCGMFQKSISISDASITEGNAGVKILTFNVSLLPANAAVVTVTFSTANITATTADGDYVPASGTLVFTPGVLNQSISVTINGDLRIENDETFRVTISTPSGFVGIKTEATGTIINDDFPAATVSSVTRTRPDVGTIDYAFTVTLSAPAPFDVVVPYTTEDASAVQDTDFVKTSGVLVFTPGQLSQIVHVTVLGGTNPQLDKIFYLVVQPSSTVTAGTPSKGVGTIISNSPPAITADDAQVTQSLTGVALLAFTVHVDPSLTGLVTVNYTTADVTAIAGIDYTPQAGVLNFIPGRIVQTVYVPVSSAFAVGGAAGDKTLTLNLSSIVATGTVPIFNRAAATGTIHYLATSSIPFSARTRANYTDYLGNRVVAQLIGPGSGAVVFLGSSARSTDAIELQLTGTTRASTLLIRTAGGQTAFRSINAASSVGTIFAPTTNLLGGLTTLGSLNRLNLNFVQAGNFTVGAGSGTLAISLGRALDTSITSIIPISSLTAQAYLNTDGIPDIIATPTFGGLRVRGNFGGTVLANSVSAVFVGGTIENASIQSTGSVGVVVAGRITDSTIFAGVRSGLSSLPTSSDDFVNKDAQIARVVVRAGGFNNTLVAGWRIGAVSLGRVQTTSGAATFGLSGDRVGAVTAFADSSPIRVIGADDPLTSRASTNFVVRAI